MMVIITSTMLFFFFFNASGQSQVSLKSLRGISDLYLPLYPPLFILYRTLKLLKIILCFSLDVTPRFMLCAGTGTMNDMQKESHSQIGSSIIHLLSSIGPAPPTAIPGVVYNVAGNGVPGNSDNLAANISEVVGPTGVWVDTKSNIYITQYGSHRVRKIVKSTGIIYTIAGTGIAGYNGDTIAATNALLNQPLHSTTDGSLNLYIADYSNNRIRKVDVTSGIISTFAGTGVSGYVDNVAAVNAQMNRPSQLAFDSSGNLFFGDAFNKRLRMISSTTGQVSTIVYIPNSFIMHITLDKPGSNVYIGDAGNMQVVKYTISTGILTVLAGTGVQGSTSDGFSATSSSLNWPRGIVFDPYGTLYFADAGNCRIRKIDNSGILTTVVGTGICSFNGNGLPSIKSNTFAEGLAFANNTLYFAEEQFNRVRAVPFQYACPITAYSPTGKLPCTACPIGLANSTGARSISACISCAPGYFSTTGQSPGCAICSPGTYQPSVGSTSCYSCRQGTFIGLSVMSRRKLQPRCWFCFSFCMSFVSGWKLPFLFRQQLLYSMC